MTKRMLIDATHAEETRVVVLDGNTLEDFDVETASRRQLKGNIYLAKVIRVEPSLQAAFVEYGGGRHGFLAFGEIHPDYYQIPVADRQRLIEMQAEEARAEESRLDELDRDESADPPAPPASPAMPAAESFPGLEPAPAASGSQDEAGPAEAPDEAAADPAPDAVPDAVPDAGIDPMPPPGPAPDDAMGQTETHASPDGERGAAPDADETPPEQPWSPAQPATIPRQERFGPVETAPEPDAPGGDEDAAEDVTSSGEEPADEAFAGAGAAEPPADGASDAADQSADEDPDQGGDGSGEPDRFDVPTVAPEPPPETLGGRDNAAEESEATGEAAEARARRTSRLMRSYRIQEVIHRRQVMLVQVVKEERGTKGAALTTYISLAGRFSVLMPNSPRGGGVSRKITSASDRKRLREVMQELELPAGMGLIVRTAGANRPKPEIRRDCEYLMRLWDDIREHTLRSVAPALIYEEASLIKRAIRDVYSRDIDEIIVDGEQGWKAAHDFMRQLMPSHAGKVRLWRGENPGSGRGAQPLFARHQVEAQLEAMLSPTVQLKSGGYLVINQTEALVAIDVNSGRSTRERNVEETAVRTNLEAADEVGRQLRLRDLAGLIVIDFIDMESRKHVGAVERRLKDALSDDRARIQVGHISHFGLMEMSRQRLRPSLAETSLDVCPHCGGTGHVRSTESSGITVLRAIEDEGAKGRASVVMVHARGAVVMYLLNHKRERLAEIEARYGMRVQFATDDTLAAAQIRIDRVRARNADDVLPTPAAPVIPAPPAAALEAEEADLGETDADEDDEQAPGGRATGEQAPGEQAGDERSAAGEDGERRRRRRRRRRGGRREGGEAGAESAADSGADEADASDPTPEDMATVAAPPAQAPVELTGPSVDFGPDSAPPPVTAEAPTETEEEPAGGRRRRRGGRRRRGEAEPEAGAALAEAPQPDLPVYSGPTPANPFGGGFDIFDLLDPSTEELPQPRRAPPPPVPLAEPPPAQTTEPPPAQTMEPPPVQTMEPPPVPGQDTLPGMAAAPTPAEPGPEPDQQPPAGPDPEEPRVGPAVQPVLVGQGPEADQPRRRGWWRR